MPRLLSDPNVRLLLRVDLLLVLMMMIAGNYTSLQRLQSRVFATPEDYRMRGLPEAGPDEEVERARRVHQNHIENVLPFFVVSLLYLLTGPSHMALSLFLWGFLAARVLYSIFYIRAMQPHRTIAFTVGAMLMTAMAVIALSASV